MNKELLLQQFNAAYEKLNPQQQLAVNTIEGPVMVIAGPGTGKTQILASRIGKILLDTDALPDNILCLTYTDAGVVAMRKRLQQFIGPDAYKVNIYTFHAFCNDIIQDNLPLFEKNTLDPISDLEKIELFKELIDSFTKENPLKRYRGDVYYEVKNLQQLFSNMKREGWTPERINTAIEAYLADLPNRDEFIYKRKFKEFNVGDVKQNKIDEETERMDKLRAAVKEFDNFQTLMRQKNRYDFDDMINWVIKAFEENNNLLMNYQERFQYILVDEYQDTSGTQNKLVELLINYWDTPNIFVVGDDDQSIYRFQGANVENMLHFANSYSESLQRVVLTSNYRSTQPILDISKTLIDKNEDRLITKMGNLSKDLQAANVSLMPLLNQPVVREYPSQQQEMMGIAKAVQHLVEVENILPGRIGIIYKENKYGEEITRYLQQINIPVYSKRHINLLDLPLAQKILLFLKYLEAEHDTSYGGDEMLFEILHFDWFGIPAIEVAKITIEVSNTRIKGETNSIRRSLIEKNNAPAKDLFTPNAHEGLLKAGKIVDKLIADVSNVTLQQLFENVIRDTGILGIVMKSADKHRQLQILTALFDFIKEETRRNPRLNLADLIKLIALMEKENIALPLVQVSGSEKGVNLMTAHGSKGLEFEYVFVTGTNSAFWEKKRKPGSGYKLPDTIFEAPSSGDDLEELRRLFFVALTRAEKYLYISYSKLRNDGKDMEPSMFIAEIQDKHALAVEKIILDDEVLAEFASLQFADNMAPEIVHMEEEVIARLLEKFTMNVTALNNYLKCPLEFYFKNLIRIPSPRNEATEFGSSIHYALESLFRKMQESGTETFHNKETFIADFDWFMRRHRESFTKEQFNRRMEYGHEVLTNYYDTYINTFNKIVAIERRISKVVVNNVPLKGNLDKIEFDGKSVTVVDYKTGDPDKALPKLKGPSDKEPNGGDYWRQAVFYKILVDNYEQKEWKVISTVFDFIEPDKKKNYRREKVTITPEDIQAVTEQITKVWDKIQQREFYTGCGSADCLWCNFVKTNNLAVALHTIEETETEQE